MLTFAEVHERIESLCNVLEELVTTVDQAAQRAANTQASYESEHAKELLKVTYAHSETPRGKFTVGMAEAESAVATEVLHREHLVATARLTAARDAARMRQAQLDALRTLAASFRGAGG